MNVIGMAPGRAKRIKRKSVFTLRMENYAKFDFLLYVCQNAYNLIRDCLSMREKFFTFFIQKIHLHGKIDGGKKN